MYAVVTHLRLRAPLSAAQTGRIARELIDPLPTTPGFHSLYAVETGAGQVTVFHAWDSRADAEAAVQRFSSWVQLHLGDQLAGPTERRMGAVVGTRRR